ncbi:GNAT family N-acetyltransferase [Azospirillum canadense]|uniref:GNAT family N-acetyltransferase n=1 Tax=Azospirillum canadense TaxID=403962 RepID=UPI002227098E|nr:GNAT family N-acetyltransferase [Azospirillum canadense]MCW2236732.1 GNAT superfamily N-acetyltransferase [Azospirillum canadense]
MNANFATTDLTITRIDRLDDPALMAGLEALLEDAVASGASVGYHAPLSPALNRDFWTGVSRQLEGGAHRLLVARAPDGTVLGSVQLALCTRPNGAHRAEVQKLLVLTRHRGRGIARRLMTDVEEFARGLGRSLLVLDTLKGNVGEPFYERTGWMRAGEIPGYTVEADGSRHATVLFYKNI